MISGYNYKNNIGHSIFYEDIFECTFDSIDVFPPTIDNDIFENCTFKNCNFITIFRYVKFTNCTFIDCKFNGCEFMRVQFFDCIFENISGRNCKVRNCLHVPDEFESFVNVLPQGEIIGWKKLRNNRICKLRIPAEAKRSTNGYGKCRAEFAYVEEIKHQYYSKKYSEGISYYRYAGDSIYTVGEKFIPNGFDDDWSKDCSYGVHFFLTEIEARAYNG